MKQYVETGLGFPRNSIRKQEILNFIAGEVWYTYQISTIFTKEMVDILM